MKRNDLLRCSFVFLLLLSIPVISFGQLLVESTFPSNGDTQVDTLLTLEVSFNQPIDTTARFTTPEDFYLGLFLMEDSSMGEPDSIVISNDLKTVRFHNVHLMDDHVLMFGVSAAKGKSGESLDLPVIVTFTTGESLPTGTVSGTISFPDGNPRGAVAALYADLDEEPVAMSIVQKTDGMYTLSYVPEGTFLLAGFKDLVGTGDYEPFRESNAIGTHDPNQDRIPDLLTVTEGQSLTDKNINIIVPDFHTAKTWIAAAKAYMQFVSPEAVLMGIVGDYLNQAGMSRNWNYLFMSPSSETPIMVMTSDVVLAHLDFGDAGELPPFQVLPLVDEFLDSDIVNDSAMTNGGSDFITMYPDAHVMAMLFTIQMNEKQSNFNRPLLFAQKSLVFNFHDQINSSEQETMTLWIFQYWDKDTDSSLMLFFDGVTGSPVDMGPSVHPTTAQMNLPVAAGASQIWASDAELVMVGLHASQLTLSGEADYWFFAYYSVQKDSFRVFLCANGQLMHQGPIDWVPPSKSGLPPNWIDSQTAIQVAESNGGEQYRSTNQEVSINCTLSRGIFPGYPQQAVWMIQYTSTSSSPMVIYVDAVSGSRFTDVEYTNGSGNLSVFKLEKNHPNPFNPETKIEFNIPRETFITLTVYNVNGQKIKTLISERKPRGHYRVNWDGKDSFDQPVSSGLYIYQMVTKEFNESGKMLLLR